MSGIYLSPTHGVNPTIPHCFFCGDEKGEVALMGKLRGDARAPRNCILDMVPCDECRDHMKRGIVLLEVTGGYERVAREQREFLAQPAKRGVYFIPQPDRTGCMWVVSEMAIHRIFEPQDLIEKIIRGRWSFLAAEAAHAIGLHSSEGEE